MAAANQARASSSDLIVLNVGGTRFETSRQTLLNDPASMLAKMFDPVSPLQPGEFPQATGTNFTCTFCISGLLRDGAYFIDRDPEYFRVVLNYLRSGQVALESRQALDAVKIEAAFFGLAGLEDFISEKIKEKDEEVKKTQEKVRDEFLLNVGGEIFVTSEETLCKYKDSRLSNIVEGKCPQMFDKNGILFLDEDPKDFAYILRALRNSQNVPTAVPKEHIDNILNLRDNLEIREIKFGYRDQMNSFVSEYFLSVCR